MGNLVTCETPAAIVIHAREVTDRTPIRLGGHSTDVLTLCGSKLGWDMQLPLDEVTCRSCLAKMATLPKDPTNG